MIDYKKGNIFSLTKNIKKSIIIPHVCNNIGAWGAGFVLAISKEWNQPEEIFRSKKSSLGEVQFIEVNKTITIANMIAQHGIRINNGIPPIRYEALDTCLKLVAKKAIETGAEIHAPKFGAGLAGGDWLRIEKLIKENLTNQNISVTIYQL